MNAQRFHEHPYQSERSPPTGTGRLTAALALPLIVLSLLGL